MTIAVLLGEVRAEGFLWPLDPAQRTLGWVGGWGPPVAAERPHSVILEPPILDGGEYTLRCHVTHVFPVGYLVVTLRRGGRLLYSESLERFTDPHLANVTLTHVLQTRPLDLGLPVTCHARLYLDGLVIRSSSAPMMLPELSEAPP